ncbi:hypothetical protein ACFQ2M_16585 [Kitasatospora saccharophila]|uniref:hypothetical protein n=1 Tax=Kitasatospora saccharophila TaxID=407973 RepID=UPI003625F28F
MGDDVVQLAGEAGAFFEADPAGAFGGGVRAFAGQVAGGLGAGAGQFADEGRGGGDDGERQQVGRAAAVGQQGDQGGAGELARRPGGGEGAAPAGVPPGWRRPSSTRATDWTRIEVTGQGQGSFGPTGTSRAEPVPQAAAETAAVAVRGHFQTSGSGAQRSTSRVSGSALVRWADR